MARVTVEDCIEKVKNRFELVLVAAQRAKKLSDGVDLAVERDNDKNPVVALREIAEDKISVDELRSEIVNNFREVDDNDQSEAELDAELDKTIGGETETTLAASISPIDLEEIMKEAESESGEVGEISNNLAAESYEDQIGIEIVSDSEAESGTPASSSDDDMIG